MPLKIGAYIRVSTEEQAQVVEGSLDSQKFRIKGYLDIRNNQDAGWGKIVETYIDDGYSAKDTRRPQYQKMMRDIRTGKVNLILVTDLSRLSRSIADFCDLLKDLERFKAKFLSIKEQFDSSTPAGEMMLFNMINLAQFERKQTSERVATNFHSRALRGLKNGGAHILGYDTDPTNPGKLIVNDEEAIWVQKAFEIYLEKGSTRETVAELNGLKVPRKMTARTDDRHAKGNVWTYSAIKNLLRNRAYIGEREINCENKNEDASALKPWQKYQVAKASWQPIIESVTFNSVQRLLDAAKSLHREKMSKAEHRVFILSGVIRCGECGSALIGQSAHGKYQVHRYYNHKDNGSGQPIECSVKRYNAEEVEKTILEHLAKDAQDAGYLDDIEKVLVANGQVSNSGLKKAIQRIEKTIKKTDEEIESIFKFQLQNSLTSNTSQLVAEKLEGLSIQKKRHQETLAELLDKEHELLEPKEAITGIEDRLLSFKKAMPRASAPLLKRLIRNLYDVLFLNEGRLECFYITASSNPASIQSSKMKKASGVLPEAFSSLFKNPILQSSNAEWQFNGPKVAYWSKWWT